MGKHKGGQVGEGLLRRGPAGSLLVRGLIGAGVGAAGVVIPATAASASTASSNGHPTAPTTALAPAAAVTVTLLPTPETCNAQVTSAESATFAVFGIGGKSALQDALDCANEVLPSFTPTLPRTLSSELNSAISALGDAVNNQEWWSGLYPEPTSLFPISQDMLSAESSLQAVLSYNLVGTFGANLGGALTQDVLQAEQWTAYAASSIDTNYMSYLNSLTDPGAAFVANMVEAGIAQGLQYYNTPSYWSAVNSMLLPLPLAYELFPPAVGGQGL